MDWGLGTRKCVPRMLSPRGKVRNEPSLLSPVISVASVVIRQNLSPQGTQGGYLHDEKPILT